ncbi:transcription-repair coupling factor [Pelomicrobium methylotrophicum]|uniref:transcription-repair coupling factor n=1 Tax=Pelomicrobium methylotrophicum TaxID=2602750 RepID=UPI00196A07BB
MAVSLVSEAFALTRLVSVPAPGQRPAYTQLAGSADALALAQLATPERLLLVVTEHAQDAQRLAQEIPFFRPELRVRLLPDWETLPYDSFSPHQDLVSERLATLYHVTQRACDVVVVPVTTALYRLPPVEYVAAHTFFLEQGQTLDLDRLRAQLTLAGYSHVTKVISPGEYCVRGGLIDLFPMGSAVPYRLDLLDNEVETIRAFDVDTQRSIYPVKQVRLLPAREFPLTEEAQLRFRAKFRETFEGDPSRSRLYRDVSQGITPPGIEYYLPLFFDQVATLFDYLPPGTTVAMHGQVGNAIEGFWRDTESRYRLLRGDGDRPPLPPQALFLTAEAFFAGVGSFPRLELLPDAATAEVSARRLTACATAPVPKVAVDRRAQDPLHRLKGFLADFPGRVLILTETPGRREMLADYFAEHDLRLTPCEGFADFLQRGERWLLAVGPLSQGFVLPEAGLAFVTEAELYADHVRAREREARRPVSVDSVLRDLSEVKAGDPVVHESHGVGRFQGLVTLDLGEGEGEFLLLEYEGGDKLYVPVAQLHLISRYTGGPPEAAPLHKLGSGQWDRAKRKAMQKVRDTAAELLHLYARRAARQGHAFTLRQHDYEAFADAFGFEETPDQAQAIRAVIDDLTKGRPMDRLVCGDVGFGKTEVALRAAFVAVMDGKQVAVLVPTTLLAEQHYNNFSDRFGEWPVKVAELSRFRSAKEQAEVLRGLAEGHIDIVIGTHRLLQKDVKFKNLGLVIIDEEHRFGVRQKERLKQLRAEVDVLTLTATPIPRTLAMALEGLRDFSVIATAPERRLAIKTFVTRFSDGIVREAVLRELKRGGQVYFLHNQIETIQAMHDHLARILPEARIRIAHGQMRERELERVMRDFYQQRFSVLLCTTIIETGIDVPSANTILINHAERFGLAQLHQLRGRVGRSHHQAYAYLLVPDEAALKGNARKRLEAIQMMEHLGAGFYLAMHDLEIRGAGEVLGEAQSGEMQEVGFSLYARMLEQAVKSLKAGREPDLAQPLDVTTEINLHVPALLPESYCSDVHERLVLYKRLAHCETLEELAEMQEELIDRFGPLPEAARALLVCHRLRVLARPLGVVRIDASADGLKLQFVSNPPVDATRIIRLIQSRRNYRLSGPETLRVEAKLPDLSSRARQVEAVLKELA